MNQKMFIYLFTHRQLTNLESYFTYNKYEPIVVIKKTPKEMGNGDINIFIKYKRS